MSQHTIPLLICNDSNRQKTLIQAFEALPQKEIAPWIASQKDAEITTYTYNNHYSQASSTDNTTQSGNLLIIGQPLDTIAPLDALLNHCNTLLQNGGTLCCKVTPSAVKQQETHNRFPWPLRHTAAIIHYLWHRIGSKMWISRGLYRLLTQERHRSMSRVEIQGRLQHAGFETQRRSHQSGILTICATRQHKPIEEPAHIGAIIGLPRIGKDGKIVRIYKIRTMYAYSEFLQDNLYARHHLGTTGKIHHDYRITIVGRWLRKHWIDEIPMLCNLIRGDIKLVGVRPLSKSIFNEYSSEMQRLHTRYKPGLFPPLYADNIDIDSIEAVQDNERCYIEAYARHPWRTDWHYFWRIVSNIIFHSRRSA